MTVEIRTAGDPIALVPQIRTAVRGVDADLALGTRRGSVIMLIMRQMLMVVALGAAAGVALS